MRLSSALEQIIRFGIQIAFYCLCAWILSMLYRYPVPPVNSLLLPKRFNHSISLGPISSNENFYQVYLNGVDTKRLALIVKDKLGHIWIPIDEVQAWDVVLPRSGPRIIEGNKYYSLSSFPGGSYSVNQEDLSIHFQLPNAVFLPQEILANGPQLIKVPLPPPGAYFDYNLLDTRNTNNAPDNLLVGLFQVGVFNRFGIGTNSFILQNTPDTEWALRLLTTWRYDNPDKMFTLSLGDDVSESTLWSSSVNFGGIQWGTNFSTQPLFITFPQPGFQGQATVPSNMSLYINDGLVTSRDVHPGIYTLSNIPYVDGAGNMRIVTTDILGRERVVNLPFYVSNQLLKKGLVDYTYEFGLVRQNLGLTSFDYARFLSAATRSVGIRDDLTVQGHIEVLSDQQTLGGGVFKQIGTLGTFNGFIAASHKAGDRDGGLAMAGFQRLAENYSFGFGSEITTLYFTQQGLMLDQFSPRLINQAFGGVNFWGNSVGLNYIRQINRDAPGNNTLTGTFSRNLFFDFSLSVSGTTNLGGTKNKGLFFTITRAIGPSTSFNTSNSIQNDQHQASIQIQRSLPQGPGFGYSLAAATGSDINNKQASFSYQNNVGTYQAQLYQINGESTQSLNAEGSIIWMADHSYFSRLVGSNSFGVVEVPGFPNVDVSINNQVSASTDRFGNALIPDLLAYQNQEIKIDTNQLPMNSQVDAATINVVPYYNSGIIVKFPVREIRSATLVVKQKSGDFVPEGVSAGLSGKPLEFIVGDGGETYLTGLDSSNTVNFVWDEHVCQISFSVPSPNPKNPVPDLGTFVCNEVTNAQAKKAILDKANQLQ